MKRLLVLTTLDVRRQPNNREHHLLLHLAPRFEEVCVVYRRRCEGRGWRGLFADAWSPGAAVSQEGSVRFVEVNPLWNHRPGAARDVWGVSGVAEEADSAALRLLYLGTVALGFFKDLSTIAALAWGARRFGGGRFDVCTALGPWAAAAGDWLRRSGRVDLLAYEDRDYEPGFLDAAIRRRWAAWLEDRQMRRADVLISVGERLAALRQARTGRQAQVVTTGVETVAKAPARREPVPVLVYVGHLAPWCGIDVVLEALVAVRSAVPGTRCVVAGDGPEVYRRRLEAAIERLGLGECVDFLGAVPHEQALELLRAGGVGLATFRPSELRRYAFPLKVLEYMAHGLPTLATADSETAAVLARHDCGVSVACDPEAVAGALVDLLRDRERYRRLSANALAAAASYRWDQLMEREYQILARAWARRGVPCTS